MKKLNRRLMPLITAATLLFCLLPVQAENMASVLAAPSVEAFAKNALVGDAIRFNKDDFTKRVTGDSKLEGIIIASLPDENAGTLQYGNRTLLAGEAVTTDNLNSLSFMPGSAETVDASFEFLPVFTAGIGASSVEVSLNILERQNRPPVSEEVTVQTYKNVAVTGSFKATDPDGDPMTFKLTGKAKRGEVTVEPGGCFVYTPYQNKTGTDTITYIAIDQYGNTSNESKITIKITKAATKITYSDMEGHPAYYSALTLAGKDLMVGEKIGNDYFFKPDLTVNRGEFLALVVSALEFGELTPSLRTGFADDELIPAWAKPYISLAVKSNVVQGVQRADGRKIFMPYEPITKNQASVMLSKSLSIENAGALSVFITDSAIPAWAAQSVSNLQSAGLLTSTDLSTLDSPMTRADVAEMLCKAMDIKANSDQSKKSGLMSWVFG